MSYACIFVPDFPVEAILRAEPELRSRPLAVLEGKAPLEKVFAANASAIRAGVSAGMTRPQVEACPNLILRTRSSLREAAAHAALLDCAQSFSPGVEDTRCDTLVLDLDGLQSLFGPLPKIARALARRACDLGLETHVAVASNPDAAVLVARGFSGATVIDPGKEAEILGRLPVEVLLGSAENEDSAPLSETFHRWGIRDLRELAALPDVALSERLGETGIHLQKLARGAVSRALVPVEPPLVFEEAVELEYPVMLLEPLAFLLDRLLQQICARLNARSLATQELRLELELVNGYAEEIATDNGRTPLTRPCRAQTRQVFRRILRLPVPLLDARTFLKLLQLDLKAHPPGAPIVKIHLAAEPAKSRAAQSGLFVPASPEPEKLELTLARIAGIVGEDKVGSLELLDTHRPEGFRMMRFGCGEREGKSSRAGTRSGNSKIEDLSARLKSCPSPSLPFPPCVTQHCSEDLVTALRIFRPPVGITVTVHEGKPTMIACTKRREIHGEILWTAGPWRSTGDWWEQTGWAREEWDVAVQAETNIVLYRLVRDLLRGDWFVEGSYD